MTSTLRDWLDRMRDRFLEGKVVYPVVQPHTRRPYPVTTPYGVPGDWAAGYHTGEDHACPIGSWALATTYGTVLYTGPGAARWGEPYGTQIIVRTKDGRYDYAHNHLSDVLVSVGEQVVPGQVLALTGATGRVTGAHSHFEARPAGGSYGSDVHPIRVKAKLRKKK